MPPLLILPVLLLFATADAYPAACRNATCGDKTIAYPFWLNTSSGSDCGYPSLGLLCEDDTTLILPVQPHQYTVLSIDYSTHTISLTDVDVSDGTSCPRLHFNLTIETNSWLQLTPSDTNITFLYNCKKNASSTSAVELTQLSGCLGSEYNQGSYVFPDNGVTGAAYEYECEEVVVAPVLDAHKKDVFREYGGPPAAKGSLREVLSGGFEMRYNPNPDCGRCERSGGWCGYRRNQTERNMQFTCFCDDGPTRGHCGGEKKGRKIYIIASGILLLCLLFFAFLLGRKKYMSKKRSKETPRIESFLQKNGTLHPKRYTYAQVIESFLQKNGTLHPKRYTYAQVKRMTKSFAEKLGQGGFGAVYRGDLSDGRQIAVKMLKDSKADGEDFINEVASISKTSHVNVVTLIGFCLEGSKRALIYDYMPNGSLERYAFNENYKGENTLSWEKLFDITVGIARGLEYLHRGCNTRIVHFDIKPHNILLDQDFCPKISDFGLAKLCLNKESAISIGCARGTMGYIAPEVYSKQFGAVSSKSDVYSYGMVVLEMVGARDKNVNANSESSSQYFPQWIYEHLDEYCVSASEINGEITEIVRKMIVVGLWCIQVIPTNRPTMTRVVEMLEGSTSGLELPPKVQLTFC